MEWTTSKICDLYEIGSGISITPDKYGRGYPFLTFKDIFNSPYIKNQIETLVESSEKDRLNSSIQKGDVFLTRTSETAEELGMSTVALKDYPEATFNGFSKRLRPLNDDIVPLYAAYFFRSPYFRAQASSMSSIITRASLNNTNISHFSIKYPSKEYQLCIGKMLFAYDSQIENNQKRIKLLEQMAENLYKEWFVRFRFPGYESTEFECGIPKEWEYKSIDSNEYCSILPSGINEFCGKKVYLATADVDGIRVENRDTTISYQERPSRANMQPVVDSVWFAKMKDSRKLLLVDDNMEDIINHTILSTGFTGIKVSHEALYFLFCYLMTKTFDDTKNMFANGSTQQALNNDRIKRIKVLFPTKEIISKFNTLLAPCFSQIYRLEQQNDLLTTQRDLLLPRLMSGKLEVNGKY